MIAPLPAAGPRLQEHVAHDQDDRHRLVAMAGLVYVVLTLSSSWWFVYVVDTSLNNNLFWPHWNDTGFQMFLIDVLNVHLDTAHGQSNSDEDFLSPTTGVAKFYGLDNVKPAEFHATYGRRVLHTQLNTVARAIRDIRDAPPSSTLSVMAHYCWVDFGRRWDIAHTATRARRCRANYTSNAAMYMETIARNTDWKSWLVLWGSLWTPGIGDALMESPEGVAWLADRPVVAKSLSVVDEVAFLRSINLTTYILQWQNQNDVGVDETILLENAFGMRHTVTIKAVKKAPLGWTSLILYTNLLNDLNFMKMLQTSLVRGSTRFFEKAIGNYSILYGAASRDGEVHAQNRVFFSTVGPFGSVDAFVEAVPLSLVKVYMAFMDAVDSTQWSRGGLGSDDSVFVPMPPSYAADGVSFFGGNLLCRGNPLTLFPQASLNFDDSCNVPLPFYLAARDEGILFALFASDYLSAGHLSASALCTPHSTPACPRTLEGLASVFRGLQVVPAADSLALARADLPPVVFVQYAQDSQNKWVLLQQPLVTTDATWSFYGWLAIVDWIEGRREVIRLEGDISTIVVMSEAYPKVPLSDHDNETAQNGTRMLFYLIVYTTAVALAVGGMIAIAVATNRLRIAGVNLFSFNRVASTVWIGRPLLLLRGLAAVIVLSTCQGALVHQNGRTRLENTPRSILSTMVVVGESTWLSYALHDALIIAATDRSAVVAARVTAALAFAATLVLELQYPVLLTTTIHRDCTVDKVDVFVRCRSGVMAVGSKTRLIQLLVVHVGSFIVGGIAASLLRAKSRGLQIAPLVMHGAAALHLQPTNDRDGATWHLDDVACIMCGLVPLVIRRQVYLLDIKLWDVLANDQRAKQRVRLSFFACVPSVTTMQITLKQVVTPPALDVWWRRLTAISGLTLILLSVAGSVSYIALTHVNLANDFFWATFNLTSHHTSIAFLFNRQVTLGRNLTMFRLDEPRWRMGSYYAHLTTQLLSAPLLGPRLQFEVLNSIPEAIRGLRRTFPCDLVWVFSQYCWVDFNRSWELAHTAARQQRCVVDESTNAAVYMESLVRNTDWAAFTKCWGVEFMVAIGAELQQSVRGKQWLAAAEGDPVSVDEEVAHWVTVGGVDHYTVQWQNYKSLGLQSSYTIENAFGLQYAMTITHSTGAYRFLDQTSFKMYWGLGNDLAQVAANSTDMRGKSLIRSSANFAFTNSTFEDALVQISVMAYPLVESFWLVQRNIGPFGSIDMRNMPCPASVKLVLATSLDLIGALGAANPWEMSNQTALNAATIAGSLRVLPASFATSNWLIAGGSLLCEETSGRGSLLSTGLIQLVSRTGRCGQTFRSMLPLTKDLFLPAVLAVGITNLSDPTTSAAACRYTDDPTTCSIVLLRSVVTYLRALQIPPEDLAQLQSMAASAATDVWQLQVSLFQYVVASPTSPLEFLTYEFFDPTDATFKVWAWLYMLQWAMAEREVIQFQGDAGKVSVITEWTAPLLHGVHANELPSAVAQYAQRGVQYVTFMLLAISSLAAGYIAVSRGHFEGQNMFELNRVAGLVWVGRPFLCLRGITALTLLSTVPLELHIDKSGHFARFVSPELPWYKLLLGSSEATWLAYVLNDMFMIVTKHYTRNYAAASSMLVSAIVAFATLQFPATHSTTLRPRCYVDQMDFQLDCHVGTVAIGSVARLYSILVAIVGTNVLCFAAVRALQPKCDETEKSSLLLSSAAKYLFERTYWTHRGIYYMDPASALLSGLITLRWRGSIYMMDIKLWRGFVLELDASEAETLPLHLQASIPLHE